MFLAVLSTVALMAPTQTDVCTVIAQPASYNGRRITVSGEFRTDWRHGALIVGSPCGRGLRLALADEAVNSEAWSQIEATRAYADRPTITLRVTGTFRWAPNATGMYPPTHVLTADGLADLTIAFSVPGT